MKCTSCSGKMREERQGHVVVDMCTSCGAVFFEPGELGASRGVSEYGLWHRTVSREASARIDCPSCRLPMHATDLEGIMIDGCTNCGGFFLDWPSVYALVRDRTDHDEGQTTETGTEDRSGWFFGQGIAATFVGRLFG